MAAVKDALDPSWINAPGGVGPSYDAEELRRLQGYQLAGGATPGTSRTGLLNPRDLALSLSGGNVMVGAGGAVIGTAKGAYVCGVAATTTIGALLAADVTNPRRDRVVLEILDPDNGGGAGRKAQLRIIDGTPNALAATGGGFPPAPTSPFIDLGYVDVPKSGAGSPSVTINAPLTAAAGAPIPVRTADERDALPKWIGLQVSRLDLRGATETWYGIRWARIGGTVEFTSSSSPLSGVPYGAGQLTAVAPAAVGPTADPGMAVPGPADFFTVPEAGTYSIDYMARIRGGGVVLNRSKIAIVRADTEIAVGQGYNGGDAWSTSIGGVSLNAGESIELRAYHLNGVQQTWDFRTRVTRTG